MQPEIVEYVMRVQHSQEHILSLSGSISMDKLFQRIAPFILMTVPPSHSVYAANAFSGLYIQLLMTIAGLPCLTGHKHALDINNALMVH